MKFDNGKLPVYIFRFGLNMGKINNTLHEDRHMFLSASRAQIARNSLNNYRSCYCINKRSREQYNTSDVLYTGRQTSEGEHFQNSSAMPIVPASDLRLCGDDCIMGCDVPHFDRMFFV
jgi:hypothetical protein